MTATEAQVDTLAELLSWTSGEFTRYSPDAHPDHNRWSWRGDGHGGKVCDEFRAQARLLLGEGVAVGGAVPVGSFEGARSDEQGEEASGGTENAEGAQIGFLSSAIREPIARALDKPTVLELVGDGCECWVTPEHMWLSAASCGYGGGYEPGSQVEFNSDCPKHGRDESASGAREGRP